jgi:MFS family permease
MMERFGNGMQAAPRDAIIADIVPRKKMGASYGLKRTLAYAGSFIGGFLGIICMDLTNSNYQKVFAIATVPAFIAISILLFFVKEPKRYEYPAIVSQGPIAKPKTKQKFIIHNFKYLGKHFWILVFINIVFMMARMNETFIILYANSNFEVLAKFAPLVMIICSFGTTISSYPIGLLGDKLNRTKVLFLGIILLVMADIIMFSASTLTVLGVGICFWGLQYGATQNIFVSLVAEKIPEDLRGTGFGIYWLTNAIASFIADTLAGYVSHSFSLAHIFVASGIIALVSLAVLAFFVQTLSSSRQS